MTGYVILDESDRAGWHVEVIRGVAKCGGTFDLDRDDVRREPYENPADPDHSHATLCFDCFPTPRGFADRVDGRGQA